MAERPLPAAPPARGGLLDRLLAPKVVFWALAAIFAVGILLSPEGLEDESARPLSTTSYERHGLRGWYEGADRLGWKVSRRESRFRPGMDSGAVYVVLSPVVQPTASEVGSLLDAVRRGAGLVVSPARGSPLADSLRLFLDGPEPYGFIVSHGTLEPPVDRDQVLAPAPARADTNYVVTVADSLPAEDSSWIDTVDMDADSARDEAMRRAGIPRRPIDPALRGYDRNVRYSLRATRPLPPDTVVFLGVLDTERMRLRMRPSVMGMPLGAGRVVAVADPRIFRNQLQDDDDLVVLPQRILEWAAPGPGARVEFDEYHHGAGRHASVLRVVKRALAETAIGHASIQWMVAGLVLLLALGTRPIPPRPRMKVERRSPFEHVGALSRAYAQIGATRLAARRLARGVKRRHGAANKGEDDAAYLRRLAVRHPSLAPSVERIVAAMQQPLPPREFTMLADDIDTIERTLTT